MKKRVRLTMKGKVQGVFYRINTQKKARKLDLTGWVKNELDGTVSAEVEGEQKNIQKLINWCQNGPEHAKVESVSVSWQNDVRNHDDFVINK